MACRGVDRLGMARSWTIAAAIVRCAQMRAAFKHLTWNFDVRLTRVVACGLGSAARIFRNAARFRRLSFMPDRPPISRPFPDIADHVVEIVTVRREGHHGRGALISVERKVLARERPLPSVPHLPIATRELVAPGELGGGKTPPR